jgi:hypothetical protein
MSRSYPSPVVIVSLSGSTVATLMGLRSDHETLDAVIARCANLAHHASLRAASLESVPVPQQPTEASTNLTPNSTTWPETTCGLYVASIFGTPVGAKTIGALLRNVVDAMHYLDPDVIERLSRMRARTRRYVAREGEQLHAGRRDLPVLLTRSGWWVSANIGTQDLVRSLRALCRASGLSYGKDIVFPA